MTTGMDTNRTTETPVTGMAGDVALAIEGLNAYYRAVRAVQERVTDARLTAEG